jgi:hypothetical protein
MAHRFTTSATVPSRPRCTAWCSSSRASFIAHTEASTGSELTRFIKDEFDAFLERTSSSHSTSPAASARPTRTIHGDVELAGDVRVG